MNLNKLLGTLFLCSGLLFVTQASAGGGPIYFRLESYEPLNPGEQHVVHLEVSADGPYPTFCKNCSVKLALKNPQGSDYIAQSSEKTDENGKMYAKVISKIGGDRELYASELIDSNGKYITSNSSVILRYQGVTPLPVSSVIPSIIPTNSEAPAPSASPVIIPNQSPDNSKIDELNQKVNNLENQLEESKQKQNFLEAKLNQLTSWIKEFLPFFQVI